MLVVIVDFVDWVGSGLASVVSLVDGEECLGLVVDYQLVVGYVEVVGYGEEEVHVEAVGNVEEEDSVEV